MSQSLALTFLLEHAVLIVSAAEDCTKHSMLPGGLGREIYLEKRDFRVFHYWLLAKAVKQKFIVHYS